MITTECYACRHNGMTVLPPRERVYDDGLWRVAHAFDTALPGWLVIVLRRHATSLADLTTEEAAALGPLIKRLSAALQQELQVPKAYLAFFAEGPQHPHVHIHVIPRPEKELRGPGSFELLSRPDDEWVSEVHRDRLSQRLAARLAALST